MENANSSNFGDLRFIWQDYVLMNFVLFNSYLSVMTTNIDVFQTRPSLKVYLIIQPILWPYFFVAGKSPIARLS